MSEHINEKPVFDFESYGNLAETRALRHTASHILAQAVKRIFGYDVKLSIGPATGNGFYYDFETSRRFSDEDLISISNMMKKIIKEYLQLERVFVVQIIALLAKVFLTLRVN